MLRISFTLDFSHSPFIAWVDKAHLPYHGLPESLKGFIQHQVVVMGAENGNIQVADLTDTPHSIPAELFADGREKIPSDKNRLMFVTPPTQIDLRAAIKAGIADELEHLGSTSETFSLPVYQKWAKMMTHPKDKKSWLSVFKERNGLYTALRKIYEAITLDGSEGAALRSMYADFLRQSSQALANPALGDAADAYDKAAEAWKTFANTVLSNTVPEFAETKALLQARYAALRENRMDDMQQAGAKLAEMLPRLNGTGFPLDDAATKALFERMAACLNEIYQAEVSALNTLQNVAL